MPKDDLGSYCSTFPTLPNQLITREDLVVHVHDHFGPQRTAIVLMAPDGMGKTLLLAQFAKTYSSQTVSFFVEKGIPASHPKTFLVDMCAQLSVYLNRSLPKHLNEFSFSKLEEIYNDLIQSLRKGRGVGPTPLFVVVDGLHLCNDFQIEGRSILDLLPSPNRNVCFLGSAIPSFSEFERPHYPLELKGFSINETRSLFSGIDISSQNLRILREKCSGIPLILTTTKHLLESGCTFDSVVNTLSPDIKSLFEMEWSQFYKRASDSTLKAIALVVAAESYRMTISSLAALIDVSEDTLKEDLSRIAFVSLRCESTDCFVEFRSVMHQEFCSTKLTGRLAWARDRLLSYFESRPANMLSLDVLVKAYGQTKEYEKLKAIVQPQSLINAVRAGCDSSSLYFALESFASYAAQQERWEDQFAAILGYSLIKTFSTRAVSKQEIEALLQLDDFDKAVELTRQSVLPEDKLELYCILANHAMGRGGFIDQWLRDEIDKYVNLIKPELIPERVVRIAALLFHLDPTAAINLVEAAYRLDSNNARSLDTALMTISLMAEHDSINAEEARSHIADRSMRDFARAASPIVSSYSEQRLLEEVNRIEDTSAKIFLMREWCNKHRESPEAGVVIQEALETLTAAENYPSSLRILRQFAEPLPSNPDDAVVKKIIARLDLLKEDAGHSPVGEGYRLELILAESESRYSHGAAINRLINLYYQLDEIFELDSRIYCMIRLLLALPRIDRSDELGFRPAILDRLSSEFDNLLSGSSNHARITKRILKSLSQYDCDTALAYTMRLNTQKTRDDMLYDLFGYILSGSNAHAALTSVLDNLKHISGAEMQDLVRVRIADAITDPECAITPAESDLIRLANMVREIKGPANRTLAFAYLLRGWPAALNTSQFQQVKSDLQSSLAQIDSPWGRVHVGWYTISVLAKNHRDIAQGIFSIVDAERSQTYLAEPLIAETYINLLALAIRSISGITVRAEFETYARMLISAVRRLPISSEKITLASRLALRCRRAGWDDYYEELVKVDILSYLKTTEDYLGKQTALVESAVCVYAYDKAVFFDLLEEIETSRDDAALLSILTWIVTDLIPDESFDSAYIPGVPKYGSIREACSIVDRLRVDINIEFGIRFVVNALVREEPDKKRPSETRLICCLEDKQALAIADQLESIVLKLPDEKNIRHSGYQILCSGQIGKLRSATLLYKKHPFDFITLASHIETKVPNVSDRMFVYVQLSEIISSVDHAMAVNLLQNAERELPLIQNFSDRLARWMNCIEGWKQVNDLASAKSLLQQVLPLIETLEPDVQKEQLLERAMDVAHGIDPEFAASMASSSKDDWFGEVVSRRIRVLDLKKDPKKIGKNDLTHDEQDWAALKQATPLMMRSINSKRAMMQHPKTVSNWANMLIGKTFEDSNSIFHLILQHNIAQGISSAELAQYTQACLSYLDFLTSFAGLTSNWRIEWISVPNSTQGDDLFLLHSGDRHQTVERLKDWLADNVNNYLKIVDPYFCYDDIEILKSVDSSVEVFIVTSWKPWQQIDKRRLIGDTESIARDFRTTWRRKVSDQLPPPTTIRIIGTSDGDPGPLHDRYYITDGAGLWVGTSQNHLGARDTTVKVLDNEEAARIETERVNGYLSPEIRTRLHEGQKLLVREFSLT